MKNNTITITINLTDKTLLIEDSIPVEFLQKLLQCNNFNDYIIVTNKNFKQLPSGFGVASLYENSTVNNSFYIEKLGVDGQYIPAYKLGIKIENWNLKDGDIIEGNICKEQLKYIKSENSFCLITDNPSNYLSTQYQTWHKI